MENEIPNQLSTLGHPQRLQVFRLLMRRYPDAVPAGELSTALGLKSSTLSAYLAALQRAGLVRQARSGTSLRYAIHIDAVQRMFGHLYLDCCRGRPEFCPPEPATHEAAEPRKRTVLFLCTGNSARSIMAEAILRSSAGERFNVFSAGTDPAPAPQPAVLRLLEEQGHDTAPLHSKSVAALSGAGSEVAAPVFDFVFTLCNQAANEDCPAWPGSPLGGHWGLPDPVAAAGSPEQKARAYRQSYDALRHRIEAFTALPVETLDRLSLQSAIDAIGRLSSEDLA